MLELIEVFNNPVEITWDYNEPFITGIFIINDIEYKIIAEYTLNDFLTFKFKIKKGETYSTELINDKSNNFIRVIPTIKESLLFILNNIKPFQKSM